MELDKIYLGDCYELLKDIPDKSIDLVYIDAPYDIQNGGGGFMATKIRKETTASLKPFSDGFDMKLFDILDSKMKAIYIYIWCSTKQVLPILEHYKMCKVDILVWCKTNSMPLTNNCFLPNVEYCLCIRDRKSKLTEKGLKSKWYVSATNKEDKKEFVHPTIKPKEIVKNHIEWSTQPNDVVLDCFCGSGTTCVAAKELGRHFIGMEINEQYYKIACNRINGINKYGQTSIFTNFDEV